MPFRRVLRESVAQLAFLFLPGRRVGVNVSCSAREVPVTHCPSCSTAGSLPCQQVFPLHQHAPSLSEPSSPESEEKSPASSGTSLKSPSKNGKRFFDKGAGTSWLSVIRQSIISPECNAWFKTNKQTITPHMHKCAGWVQSTRHHVLI